MYKISFLLLRSFFIAASAVSFIGISNLASANDAGPDAAHHETGAFGEPGNPKKVTRTITIEATEIAFNVKELKFRKGQTVRFIFINKGEQPHEFMIADAAEQVEHREMMIEMAGVDVNKMHHNDKNSVSTEPGEIKELVWSFTKAGKFEFACNYPGHAEVGMTGPITVE